MNNPQKLKLTGYFILAILIANLILFALRLINWITFWGVILLGFLFVWKVLPKLKHKLSIK
ncbi:hypothetical protein HON71_00335 [Candidatus Woesearchaeota archaeon]|nr:hypothetical protein [Candidatus Woesearchaeota archaeon]MBT5342115.1 hypothetical protein [Candidatus Woesearchaeota archaeon]